MSHTQSQPCDTDHKRDEGEKSFPSYLKEEPGDVDDNLTGERSYKTETDMEMEEVENIGEELCQDSVPTPSCTSSDLQNSNDNIIQKRSSHDRSPKSDGSDTEHETSEQDNVNKNEDQKTSGDGNINQNKNFMKQRGGRGRSKKTVSEKLNVLKKQIVKRKTRPIQSGKKVEQNTNGVCKIATDAPRQEVLKGGMPESQMGRKTRGKHLSRPRRRSPTL